MDYKEKIFQRKPYYRETYLEAKEGTDNPVWMCPCMQLSQLAIVHSKRKGVPSKIAIKETLDI